MTKVNSALQASFPFTKTLATARTYGTRILVIVKCRSRFRQAKQRRKRTLMRQVSYPLPRKACSAQTQIAPAEPKLRQLEPLA